MVGSGKFLEKFLTISQFFLVSQNFLKDFATLPVRLRSILFFALRILAIFYQGLVYTLEDITSSCLWYKFISIAQLPLKCTELHSAHHGHLSESLGLPTSCCPLVLPIIRLMGLSAKWERTGLYPTLSHVTLGNLVWGGPIYNGPPLAPSWSKVCGTRCTLCMVFCMSLLRDNRKYVLRYCVITSLFSKVKSSLVNKLLGSNICSFSWDKSLLAAPWWSPVTRGLAVYWCSLGTSLLIPLDWWDTLVPSEECSGWCSSATTWLPNHSLLLSDVGLFLYHMHYQTPRHPVPHSAETLLAVK